MRLRRKSDPSYEFWGCDYCADPDNRQFGHLDQICDSVGGVVLLRCPLCESIYEPSDSGDDRWRRVTPDEAASVLPVNEWNVTQGDA